jgi:hypothetical protein
MSVETKTELNIQVTKRKRVTKDAIVVEAFHQKYIKLEFDDAGVDHVFELRWNGFQYEGKFLDSVMTCLYKVTRDFSAKKIRASSGQKPELLQRKKSGYPNR